MTVVIIDIEINLLKGEQIRTRQFIQNIIFLSFKAWRQAFVAILIRFLSHIFRVSRMHTLWADGEVDRDPLRCAFIVLCLRYHIQFANIFQVDKILHWLNHHFHFTFKLKSYFLQVKTTTWVKRRSRTGLLGTKISQCKKSQKTNIQLSNNIFTNLPLQFSLTIPNPVKKF